MSATRVKEFQRQGLTEKEYNSIHKWVSRRTSKDRCCAHCGQSGIRIENALIKGKLYERNLDNYIPLCLSCHAKYDDAKKGIKFSDETRLRMSESKKGTTHTEETKRKMSLMRIGNTYAKGIFGRGPSKKVIDSKTGKIYNTISEAALANGIHLSRLSILLNGKKNNKTNLKFL